MPSGTRPDQPVGTARVAIQGTVLGHRYANVFYLELTHGVVTVNDLKTLADGIEALWVANVKPSVPSQVTLNSVAVRFVPSAGQELVYVGTYSQAGSAGTTMVSDAGASFVIDFVISNSYRGGHPRLYQPGVTNDAVTNGSAISTTVQAGWATAWNAIRNGINALTSTNITVVVMGTVSFQAGGAWRSPPEFRPYTSVKFGNGGILGTQRRRLKS